MFNRRRYSSKTTHLNEAFKEDDVLVESSINAQNVDEDILDDEYFDSAVDRPRAHSLPTRNVSTSDPPPRLELEGIPEEVMSIGKSSKGTGLDDMSLSNFKLIQGGVTKERPNQYNTNISTHLSYDSLIQMRKFTPESAVKTGHKFRKTSTFVISGKSNSTVHSDHTSPEETYGIKLIDRSNVPEIFIEFDQLQLNPNTQKYYWCETFRWLRFEEYYNPELRRFDSPHLSPVSLRGISNFRKLFALGEAVLDCRAIEFANVLNNIIDSITNAGSFTPEEISEIKHSLMLRHFHAGEVSSDNSNFETKYHFDSESQNFVQDDFSRVTRRRPTSSIRFDVIQKRLSQVKMDARLELGTESLSVQVGALDGLEHTFSLFVRLDPAIIVDGLNEINCPLRFIYLIFGPKSNEDELLEVGRVFAVMMSNSEFREVGYSANRKEDLIAATQNFVHHSVLVPLSKVMTPESLSGMLPQMKQYATYFQAEQEQRLLDEIKKDMSNKNQEIMVEHIENGILQSVPFNPKLLTRAHLNSGMYNKSTDWLTISHNIERESTVNVRQLFMQFCPPFHHFIMDWKGLSTRYTSDFKDAFKKGDLTTVLIGIVFIYFVVLSPAITFGALLQEVNSRLSVSLMLVACGFYQFVYTLLSGQPLEVVGITGPVFVVEKVLSPLANAFSIDLEVMKFWIGIYVAIFGLAFTSFNGVIIIKHFRRSVEEVYNFLVAAIFILSAFFSMFKNLPYTMTPLNANQTNIDVIIKEREKFGIGGTTLFLAFFMANFCIILVKIKRGSFFRRQIRQLLGSFNVPLGILLIITMERIFFRAFKLPTLNVPPSNVVNVSLWFNSPNFANVAKLSVEAHGFCILISLSLFAILITEISTNSISTTKTERRLVKPSLYSLNYFYILVLFPVISAITGWPFVSGAMVRSNAHCLAMSKWSLPLPGVPAKVIGAIEQRLSGIVVGILVFLSVFLGSALHYIPMASMYGMFLYMGIMGAKDLVFTRRTKSILQRRKYWGADEFLKDYPTWNIGILILIQGIFIGLLITLNCISEFTKHNWVTLLFPMFVGLYAALRGYALPKWSRLNSHLSKMDKKHPVKLYADEQALRQFLLTMDDKGVSMKIVASHSTHAFAVDSDGESIDEKVTELDTYW